MKKKFAIIIDNFDRTTINKNVGLFAKALADRGIRVDIITNRTEQNHNLTVKNYSVIRLATSTEWPPLENPSFYDYMKKHIDSYFGIWGYKGRPYMSWVANKAYDKKIKVLLKLDSDSTLSKAGRLISSLLSIFHISPTKGVAVIRLILRKLPLFSSLKGFYLYDIPLFLSSVILCETPDHLNHLVKYIPPEKLFLYPNSLPVTQLHAFEKKHASEKWNKQRLILSVGRILPQKGFEKGILAFAQLPHNLRQQWKYEIIGPIHDEAYAKKLHHLITEFDLHNLVKIRGGIYQNELYKIYALSSVLLMPYNKPNVSASEGLEGQPNVIVDAMYFHNTIVTTNVGSVSFLLDKGKCGIIMPNNSVETIIHTLSSVLSDDKEREELGNKARARVEEEFNLDKRLPELFEKIGLFCSTPSAAH